MDFGWKKKADLLKMVILSAGHQLAVELPTGLAKMLALFERVAQTGDGRGMQEEMQQLRRDYSEEPKPMWEPAEIYGWKIQATLYRRSDQLWWLVHAVRKNETAPLDKHIAILEKVLDHMGAVPSRHAIIGPRSGPLGEPPLPFGWWTWENRHPLYTVQLNKEKKRDHEKIRIVPLGSRETDGYESINLARSSGDGDTE